jgi:hypothetical protein
MEPITAPRSCDLGVGSALSEHDLQETLAIGMGNCEGRFNVSRRNGPMTKREEAEMERRDIITSEHGSLRKRWSGFGGCELGTHSVRETILFSRRFRFIFFLLCAVIESGSTLLARNEHSYIRAKTQFDLKNLTGRDPTWLD